MSLKVLIVLSLIAAAACSPAPQISIGIGGRGNTGIGIGVGGRGGGLIGGVVKTVFGALDGVAKTAVGALNAVVGLVIGTLNDVFSLICNLSLVLQATLDGLLYGVGTLFARLVAVVLKIAICVLGLPGDRGVCARGWNAQWGIKGELGANADAWAYINLFGVANPDAQLNAYIDVLSGGKGIGATTGSINIALTQIKTLCGFITNYKQINRATVTQTFVILTTVSASVSNSRQKDSGLEIINKVVPACGTYFKNNGYADVSVQITNIRTTCSAANGDRVNWNANGNTGITVSGGTGLVGGLLKGVFGTIKGVTNLAFNALNGVLNVVVNALNDVFSLVLNLSLVLQVTLNNLLSGLGNLFVRIVGCVLKIAFCVLGFPGDRSVCNRGWNAKFGINGELSAGATALDYLKLYGLLNCQADFDAFVNTISGGKGITFTTGSVNVVLTQMNSLCGFITNYKQISRETVTQTFVILTTVSASISNSRQTNSGIQIIEKIVPQCGKYFKQNGYPDITDQVITIKQTCVTANGDSANWNGNGNNNSGNNNNDNNGNNNNENTNNDNNGNTNNDNNNGSTNNGNNNNGNTNNDNNGNNNNGNTNNDNNGNTNNDNNGNTNNDNNGNTNNDNNNNGNTNNDNNGNTNNDNNGNTNNDNNGNTNNDNNGNTNNDNNGNTNNDNNGNTNNGNNGNTDNGNNGNTNNDNNGNTNNDNNGNTNNGNNGNTNNDNNENNDNNGNTNNDNGNNNNNGSGDGADCGKDIGGVLELIPGVARISTNIISEIVKIKVNALIDIVNLVAKTAIALGGIVESIVSGLGAILVRIVAVILKIGVCVNGWGGDKSICNKEWNAQFGVIGDASNAADLFSLYRLNNCKNDVAGYISTYTKANGSATGLVKIIIQVVTELSNIVATGNISKTAFNTVSINVITLFGACGDSYKAGSGTVVVRKVLPILNVYFVKQGFASIVSSLSSIIANINLGAKVKFDWSIVKNVGSSIGDALTDKVKEVFGDAKNKNNVNQASITAVLNLEAPRDFDGVLSFGINVVQALASILDISIKGLGTLIVRLVGCLVNYIVAILGAARNSKSFVAQKAFYTSFGVTVSGKSWSALSTGFKINNCKADLDAILAAYTKNQGLKSLKGAQLVIFNCAYGLVDIAVKGTGIVEADLTAVFRIVTTLLGGFANSLSANVGKTICDNMLPTTSFFLEQNGYPSFQNTASIYTTIATCNNVAVPWAGSASASISSN